MGVFYTSKNTGSLGEKIFNMYKHLYIYALRQIPKRLTIITGTIGYSNNSPIFTLLRKINKVPLNVKIIAGMYHKGKCKMTKGQFNSLKQHIKDANNNSDKGHIDLKFSIIPVHTKAYVWQRKDGGIIRALIGSANFSHNGLNKPWRELMVDIDNDKSTLNNLKSYIDHISQNLVNYPKFTSNNRSNSIRHNTYIQLSIFNIQNRNIYLLKNKPTIRLPLYSMNDKGKFVPRKSGLNWGFSRAHNSWLDAYIRIPLSIIKENTNIIKPLFRRQYKSNLSNKLRLSSPITVIWDDKTKMTMSFEGIQNNMYPKQLASFGSKRLLGLYIRRRLHISQHRRITYDDLKHYGRDNISLSLIRPDTYYADFSISRH